MLLRTLSLGDLLPSLTGLLPSDGLLKCLEGLLVVVRLSGTTVEFLLTLERLLGRLEGGFVLCAPLVEGLLTADASDITDFSDVVLNNFLLRFLFLLGPLTIDT